MARKTKTTTPAPSALVTMIIELAADGIVCAKAPKWIEGIKADIAKTPAIDIVRHGVLKFVLQCLEEAMVLCECTPVAAPVAPVTAAAATLETPLASIAPEAATTPEAPAPEPTTPETPAATA